MPLVVTSSTPLGCPSSAETGEGRPLAGDRLALAVCFSSSGSTASLLGCGVNWELRYGAVSLSFNAALRGELRSGNLVVACGVGVLLKKPWRVRCPALELDFFNVEGVGVGVVDGAFFAML